MRTFSFIFHAMLLLPKVCFELWKHIPYFFYASLFSECQHQRISTQTLWRVALLSRLYLSYPSALALRPSLPMIKSLVAHEEAADLFKRKARLASSQKKHEHHRSLKRLKSMLKERQYERG